MDTDLIKREHLEHLNLLNNSFYSFAYLENTGGESSVVLSGNIGPVIVTYYPLVDHLVFTVNGRICIVEYALNDGIDVFDARKVEAEFQRLLVKGEWR